MSKDFEVGKVTPPLSILEHDQFYRRDNKVYCFRETCKDCRWGDECTWEPANIKVGSGTNIRRAFRAPEGWGLAAIDFAQIEIRVAAQLSGEPFWISAFRKGLDLHTAMARTGWKIPEPNPVPKHVRDAAKCCNFGCIFLGSPQTLERQSSLTLPEAVGAHRIWWDTVRTYKRWTEDQIKFYKANKYVKTFFGRRREMAALVERAESKEKGGDGKGGWGFCDRTSVNSPIQGTAADLMKIGMVRVGNYIRRNDLQEHLKMSLTVHDEIVILYKKEGPYFERLREVGRQLTQTPKGEMLPSIKGWVVPLEVDIEIGDNWAELQDINKIDTEGAEEKKKFIEDDSVVLVITTVSQEEADSLMGLVARSASVSNVVKVPIKVCHGGKTYRLSSTKEVHLPTLEEGIKRFPGVSIRSAEVV